MQKYSEVILISLKFTTDGATRLLQNKTGYPIMSETIKIKD